MSQDSSAEFNSARLRNTSESLRNSGTGKLSPKKADRQRIEKLKETRQIRNRLNTIEDDLEDFKKYRPKKFEEIVGNKTPQGKTFTFNGSASEVRLLQRCLNECKSYASSSMIKSTGDELLDLFLSGIPVSWYGTFPELRTVIDFLISINKIKTNMNVCDIMFTYFRNSKGLVFPRTNKYQLTREGLSKFSNENLTSMFIRFEREIGKAR